MSLSDNSKQIYKFQDWGKQTVNELVPMWILVHLSNYSSLTPQSQKNAQNMKLAQI